MTMFKALAAGTLVALATPPSRRHKLSIATGGNRAASITRWAAALPRSHQQQPPVDGYSATAEVTGASVGNMGLIATGDADLGIALADTVAQAYSGHGPVRGPAAADGARACIHVRQHGADRGARKGLGHHLARRPARKRVSVGAPGSGTEVERRSDPRGERHHL